MILKDRVLDFFIESLEVGFNELFFQTQLNVQVLHEQFQEWAGVKFRFKSQVLN